MKDPIKHFQKLSQDVVDAHEKLTAARNALLASMTSFDSAEAPSGKPTRTRKPKNDNGEGSAKMNLREDIKALLTEDGVKVAGILAKFPGTSESTVRSTLVNMCDNGEARRIDRGLYGSPA